MSTANMNTAGLVHGETLAHLGQAIFYLTLRVNNTHYPLAVISQEGTVRQPTPLPFIMVKTQRILQFLLLSRDRTRLQGELDAARRLYRNGREILGPLQHPPAVTTRAQKFQHDRDPAPGRFPYVAWGLREAVAAGESGLEGTLVRNPMLWLLAPLNTGFLDGRRSEEDESGSSRYVAVVFDVTDLDRIALGVVGRFNDGKTWRRQVVGLEAYCRLVCHPWLVDGQQVQFPGSAMFPPLPVVDDGILQMLCETCERPRPTARVSSLKDLSLKKLIQAAETTPEFEPHVLSRVLHIPTVAADLRRLLADAASEACRPAAMVQLLRAAFRDCRDVRLVSVRGISCEVLTRALLSDELQATRTLSFAADALRSGGSMSELVRALDRLPELTSVYVADVDAQPTEGSRMRTAAAQRALMLQARDGEGRLVRKIAVSGYYVSELMGMPIWELDGGKSFRGGRLPKEWRQRWA